VSSQCEEIRGKRQAHVGNLRTNVDIADLENVHDVRVSVKVAHDALLA